MKLFERQMTQMERLYNRDMPWLWGICQDWSTVSNIKVKQVTDPDFFNWSMACTWPENGKPVCHIYFVIANAVVKIELEGTHGQIIDAVRMLGDKYCCGYLVLANVDYIAMIVDREVRVYRPGKRTTFLEVFKKNLPRY